MACPTPTSASEVFCRAAKCRRWSARLALLVAIIIAVIIAKGGVSFIHNAGEAGKNGTAERIAGHLTVFAAQFILLLVFLGLARRRFSASHHASVKANNLKALELLAAQAPDEASKKELLARAADIVAGKSGCCK